MYAVVGDVPGLIYTSVVFGRYKEIVNGKEKIYYIVLNSSKSKLIKKYEFERECEGIYSYVHEMEWDISDWHLIDDKYGQIDFFDSNLPELVIKDMVPEELFEKCLEVNENYDYKKWKEIRTDEDIYELDEFCCNFHDACLANIAIESYSDSITATICGIGDFTVEICFHDFACCNTGKTCPTDYWFSSSMYFKDGYICFINEEDCEITPENDCYTWFRGKKAKYRILPNL